MARWMRAHTLNTAAALRARGSRPDCQTLHVSLSFEEIIDEAGLIKPAGQDPVGAIPIVPDRFRPSISFAERPFSRRISLVCSPIWGGL